MEEFLRCTEQELIVLNRKKVRAGGAVEVKQCCCFYSLSLCSLALELVKQSLKDSGRRITTQRPLFAEQLRSSNVAARLQQG